MSAPPVLLWFRQDLRLRDNPALHAAMLRGGPIVPIYIWDAAGEGSWSMGAAARWWLHHSLRSLADSLRERGARLILACGDASEVLRKLIDETGARGVYWNGRYEPASVARDSRLKDELTARGVEVRSFNSALLFEPPTIANKQGRPFQVFTPFWRHCSSLPVAAPERLLSAKFVPLTRWPRSLPLEALKLLPAVRWDRGLSETWQPGEEHARKRLKTFLSDSVEKYADERDVLARDGTSTLSPYLHFGELGPRQIWAAVKALSASSGVFPSSKGARVFLTELGWREFAHHLLFHFPHTPDSPLREDFAHFPWGKDPGDQLLRAWQQGRTGYPIVDAGMRQLWRIGWIHNRARMIVASFLVKHLRLPWRHGAAWFWDTLVDADLANNTLGWQWSAGCGADAAPYFRIFAPVLQGQKFDPDGDYVRRWVPELANVPANWIHQPWSAPPDVLAQAKVRLGETYPRPIVDHAHARTEALAAFRTMRRRDHGAS